jgi:hypothetical protein
MPVATAKMFGSKMMSSAGSRLLGQQLVGALADFDLALEGVGLTDFVEGHHDHGGAVATGEAASCRNSPRLPSWRSS